MISPNTLLCLLTIQSLIAQESSNYETSASGTMGGVVGGVIGLVVAVLMIAAMWKVFSKAGQPGWLQLSRL